MRRTDENSCRNTLARRDTKDSGVSWAAFSRPAPRARGLRFHRPHRIILNVAVRTQRDPCVSVMPDLALNQPLPRIFLLESFARPKILALNAPCARLPPAQVYIRRIYVTVSAGDIRASPFEPLIRSMSWRRRPIRDLNNSEQFGSDAVRRCARRAVEPEIDPIWWTSSEGRIRCPEWDQARRDGERVGSSRTSSGPARFGWCWTRGRRPARSRASWI